MTTPNPATPSPNPSSTDPQVFRALRIAAVARQLGVSPASIWRWARVGVRVGDGIRIKLEYRRVGRRIVIDPSAIDRFTASLAAADDLQQWAGGDTGQAQRP